MMNKQQNVNKIDRLFSFLLRVLRGFKRNQGLLLSSAVAYHTLLSIVPLSILALIVLSHFIEKGLLFHTLSTYIEMMIPGYAATLTEQVRVFLEHGRSVGIFVFLAMRFFSSIAFTVLESAMSVTYFHRVRTQRRHFLLSAIIPYVYMFLIGVGILLVSFIAGAIETHSGRQLVIFRWVLSLEGPSIVALYIIGILGEVLLLTMPVTLPGASITEVNRILQEQDKIIKAVPEVHHVLGKTGRAETATDNAPLCLIETIIVLKPRDEWRPGVTKQDIVAELDHKLQIPGVTNGWTQPIINRINMLSTGVRTDIGFKIFGKNLDTLEVYAIKAEGLLKNVDGAADVVAERVQNGYYLDIQIKREIAARYGVNISDLQDIIETARRPKFRCGDRGKNAFSDTNALTKRLS